MSSRLFWFRVRASLEPKTSNSNSWDRKKALHDRSVYLNLSRLLANKTLSSIKSRFRLKVHHKMPLSRSEENMCHHARIHGSHITIKAFSSPPTISILKMTPLNTHKLISSHSPAKSLKKIIATPPPRKLSSLKTLIQ